MNLVERARMTEEEAGRVWYSVSSRIGNPCPGNWAPWGASLDAQLAKALWVAANDIEDRMILATDLTDYGRGYHNALRDIYLGWTTQFEVAELEKPERKEDNSQ